ncbi:Uncharacterised protein [Halioglobus japonicus]|nr:Uncharacterised protein [Halioglobus japonicus]
MMHSLKLLKSIGNDTFSSFIFKQCGELPIQHGNQR